MHCPNAAVLSAVYAKKNVTNEYFDKVKFPFKLA